jgi:hypothetical protein
MPGTPTVQSHVIRVVFEFPAIRGRALTKDSSAEQFGATPKIGLIPKTRTLILDRLIDHGCDGLCLTYHSKSYDEAALSPVTSRKMNK